MYVSPHGTATVETAMMELPTILLYQYLQLYGIGKMVVNAVTHGFAKHCRRQKEVIPELLQDAVTPEAIVSLVLWNLF